MSPTESLRQCLAAYRELFRLTEEQETLLRRAEYGALVDLLARKDRLVEEAGRHWAAAQAASAEDRSNPAFAQMLGELRAVMARLVEAERRCTELVPPPAPRARRAVAAYRPKK